MENAFKKAYRDPNSNQPHLVYPKNLRFIVYLLHGKCLDPHMVQCKKEIYDYWKLNRQKMILGTT